MFLNYSAEVIEPQLNDPSVSEIIKIFEEIRGLSVKGGHMRNRKPIAVLFKKLDNVVYKRFGLPSVTENVDSGLAYCVPIHQQSNTVLSKYYELFYSMAKSEVETASSEKRKPDQLWADLYHGTNEITQALHRGELKIDLKRAYITGIPRSARMNVRLELGALFDKLNLTSREVAAIYLHEVGHLFTHMEYTQRAISNTVALVDTMHAEVKKSKDGSVSRTADKLNIKLTSMTEKGKSIEMVNYVLRGTMDMFKENVATDKDSERLADQFAARLGLGPELTESLAIINKHYLGDKKKVDYFAFAWWELLWVVFLTVVMVISLPYAGFAYGIIMALAILNNAYILIYSFLYQYAFHGGISEPYDTDLMRATKVKRDLIRMIRTENLPKKDIEDLLVNIDRVDFMIEIAESNPYVKNIFWKMVTLFKSYKDAKHFYEVEELIESLTENELHVQAARINTMRKG